MKLPIRLYSILISKLTCHDIKPNSVGKSKSVPIKQEEIAENDNILHVSTLKNREQDSKNEDDMKDVQEIASQKENNDSDASKNEEREIQLKHHIQDLEDFDEILHKLNLKGKDEGISWKRGTIQYWDDKSIKYKSIICSCIRRHVKGVKKQKRKIITRVLKMRKNQIIAKLFIDSNMRNRPIIILV